MTKNGNADLPIGWTAVALSQIAEINPRRFDTPPEDDELVSFVPMASVEAGTGRLDASSSRPWAEIKRGYTTFQTNDVLFAKITPCMENGKFALARGLRNDRAAGSTEFHVIRSTTAVLPKYVLMYVLQKSFRGEAKARMAGAVGHLRVPADFLNESILPLPPLPEQHRIVAAIEEQFTRLDAAVAGLKRTQANLKRYRAAVLTAACSGRLVPTEAELAAREGRSYEPADQLLQRILEVRRSVFERNRKARGYSEPQYVSAAELFLLPEGWALARAEQICDFITKGTTPSADQLHSRTGEIPFIKVYNLTHTGSLDFSVNPTFVARTTHENQLSRSRVIPGDVLMNIVGPPLGKVSVVPDTYPEWNMNQAVAVFRPIGEIHRKWLVFMLLSDPILSWAERRAKATAGQFNLTLQICRDLPIPIPPIAEQCRIVEVVERQLSVVEELQKTIDNALARAERLRQSILRRAFEGKLVPQDPTDEPADVLLERIKAERTTMQANGSTRRSRSGKSGAQKQLFDLNAGGENS